MPEPGGSIPAAAPDQSCGRILLTGASSALGQFLSDELRQRGGAQDLCPTFRSTPPPGARGSAMDLRRADAIDQVVGEFRPSLVLHVASVRGDAATCRAVNEAGTRDLLAACSRLREPPAVLFVSSSAVYGAGDGRPLAETATLSPVGAYGASKAAAEELVRLYGSRRGARVHVVRPFNLIGPRLRPGTAPADFAQRLVAIRRGEASPEIHVGALDAVRDFVDVRDAARACLDIALAPNQAPPVCNVASGHGVAIRTILEKMIQVTGVRVTVRSAGERRAASTVPAQIGDTDLLRRSTGWRAAYELDRSIRDQLDS